MLLDDLDLIDEDEQFTHMLTLDSDSIKNELEMELNVFRFDPEFQNREKNYKQIKQGITSNFFDKHYFSLHKVTAGM